MFDFEVGGDVVGFDQVSPFSMRWAVARSTDRTWVAQRGGKPRAALRP
jgi:hypothetical protein